ncbi:MAG: hypothetical protein ACYCWW_04010 [Deltaproteobacteria bacterium]
MSRRTLVLVAVLSGCVYSFDNPVQAQPSGSVTGQLSVVNGAAGQTAAGATIDLLWSGLSITADATGRFSFFELPSGSYTLRYRVPPAASNDFPVEGERPDLYLPAVGGAPDTIALGTVQLSLAGRIAGTVIGGPGAVVGSFAPSTDGGIGQYEGYSTAADGQGHYQLDVPAGRHTLWASTDSQSASLDVSVAAGQPLASQDLFLSGLASAPTGLVGYVEVGDLGADAQSSQIEALLGGGGLAVGLSPPCPSCTPSLTFQTPAPAAGVTAAQLFQPLMPGQLYDVTCAVNGQGQLVPAVLRAIPAIAGQSTSLGQITLLTVKTAVANGAALSPSDGGADAGPVVPDAGPADAGPADGGPWFEASMPFDFDGGFDVTPYPEIGGADGVIWADGSGALHVDQISHGTLVDGGVLPIGLEHAGTLTIASQSLKNPPYNAAAWATGSGSLAFPIALVQEFSGGWTLTGNGYSWCSGAPGSLALVNLSSGELWLAEISMAGGSSLAIEQIDGGGPSLVNDGGYFTALAATACPLAGGEGICLAATDSMPSFWVAIFDPSQPTTLTGGQVGTLSGQPLAAPTLTALPGGDVVAVVAVGAPTGGPIQSYAWTTFNSLTLAGSSVPPLQSIAALDGGAPALFTWGLEPLLLFQSPNGAESFVVDGGPPPPLLPGSFWSPPRGYVDSAGAVHVAAQVGQNLVLEELPLPLP